MDLIGDGCPPPKFLAILALASLPAVGLTKGHNIVALVKLALGVVNNALDDSRIGRAQLEIHAGGSNALAPLHAKIFGMLLPQCLRHSFVPSVSPGAVNTCRLTEAVGQRPISPSVHAAGDIHKWRFVG